MNSAYRHCHEDRSGRQSACGCAQRECVGVGGRSPVAPGARQGVRLRLGRAGRRLVYVCMYVCMYDKGFLPTH